VYVCVKFHVSIYNSFRDMRGSEIYTTGVLRPSRPLAEKCHTRNVCLTLS